MFRIVLLEGEPLDLSQSEVSCRLAGFLNIYNYLVFAFINIALNLNQFPRLC